MALNFLYRNYQGDRLQKFVSDFSSGFHGFTDKQKAIIQFYNNKLKNIKSELQVFGADVPIKNKKYKFVSTFANECINEVAEHIIDDNSADVGLVVNLRSNKISFRKNKQIDLDLSRLAKKFTGGGGHSYAAGGQMTKDFLTFSKVFQPIK